MSGRELASSIVERSQSRGWDRGKRNEHQSSPEFTIHLLLNNIRKYKQRRHVIDQREIMSFSKCPQFNLALNNMYVFRLPHMKMCAIKCSGEVFRRKRLDFWRECKLQSPEIVRIVLGRLNPEVRQEIFASIPEVLPWKNYFKLRLGLLRCYHCMDCLRYVLIYVFSMVNSYWCKTNFWGKGTSSWPAEGLPGGGKMPSSSPTSLTMNFLSCHKMA